MGPTLQPANGALSLVANTRTAARPSKDGPPDVSVSFYESAWTCHIVAMFHVPMTADEKIEAAAALLLDHTAPSLTSK